MTDVEAVRVGALIADASATIRIYTRQTITEETTTDVLQIRNGRIRLPQRPVTDVATVVNVNGDPVLYQRWGNDQISASSNVPDNWAWEPWRNGVNALTVTYTHGYNPVPDEIVGVCCSIVMRAFGRDPIDAGIQSESIQGYSYTLGTIGAAGPIGLLQSEKDILDVYCRVGGQIITTPAWIT